MSKFLYVLMCFYVTIMGASAQVTNTASAVAGAVTAAASSAYDAAITICISVIAIGAAVMLVRKGLKGRM